MIKIKLKSKKKFFGLFDYIILSPGISLNNTKLKTKLIKNKKNYNRYRLSIFLIEI